MKYKTFKRLSSLQPAPHAILNINNNNRFDAKGIVLSDRIIYPIPQVPEQTIWKTKCHRSTDFVDSATNQCRIVPPLLADDLRTTSE